MTDEKKDSHLTVKEIHQMVIVKDGEQQNEKVDWMGVFQGIAALGPKECPKSLLVDTMDRFHQDHRSQLRAGKISPVKLLQILLLKSPLADTPPTEQLFVDIFLKLQSACGVEIISQRYGYDGPKVVLATSSSTGTQPKQVPAQ